MHWKNKARIQSLIAKLPGNSKYPVYYWMQKKFGSLGKIDIIFELRKAAEIIELIESQNLSIDKKSFLEIGTGRTVNTEIGLWLCGAGSITAVDLNPYLSKELVVDTFKQIQSRSGEVAEVFSKLKVDRSRISENLEKLVESPADFNSILKMINLNYLAPCDAAEMDMEDASIDFHISTNVLEHVPPEEIKRILKEAKRLLRPEGLLVHRVDPSDHFAHSDPSITAINFLRFSQAEWDRLSDNTFSYHNRLRVNQYYELFEKCDVEILSKFERIDENSLNELNAGFPTHPDFLKFGQEELAKTFFSFAARFNSGPQ